MTRIPALGPRGEGWLALQVVLLLAIPLAAWRSAIDPGTTPDLPLLQEAGGIVLLVGLGLIFASMTWLRRGRALSALPRPLEDGSLVDTGPYRLLRHPIYTGVVLAAAGVAMIRASIVIAVLALALFVVLDLKRRREEAWLRERYADYDAYRERTKALVPFLY